MNKERFIEQYVASFLGAYAANVYYHADRPNWQKTITEHAPVEDACFQAEETWQRGVDLQPYDFVEDPKEGDPF